MTATPKKTAHATRTAGNCYDVTYPHRHDMDANVPASYLKRLVAEGYNVEIDNSKHRGVGEPATETMRSA